jgi:hypothetical protein
MELKVQGRFSVQSCPCDLRDLLREPCSEAGLGIPRRLAQQSTSDSDHNVHQ